MKLNQSKFLLVLLSLCAAPLVAQDTGRHSAVIRTPGQKSLDDLLNRISSLPPEYKADLGFTILDAAAKSLSPGQQQSLLDDIFHSAAKARRPYALTDASKSDYVAALLGNSKLDTLEIQSHAIERALPSTPKLATQLFEEMELRKDRASCKDASVENVSAFYATTAQILEDPRIKTVFDEDKSTYLLSLVEKVSVPAQIAPLAELVSRTILSAYQLAEFQGAFVSALARTAASDREMIAAESGGNLTNAVRLLSTRFAQSGIYPGRLLSAYRGFLVQSLTPESCADNSLDRTEVARNFNALLLNPLATAPDVVPLSAAQLESQSKGASADNHTFVINTQMMTKLFRIGAAQAASSTEEYRSGQLSTVVPEFQDMEDVIQYAVSVEPAGSECPVCEFEQKGALLQALVQLFPVGSELDKAVNAEMNLLPYNGMQKDEPVAWLHIFKQLVNVGRRSDDRIRDSLTAKAKKGTLLPMDAPSTAVPEIRKILHGSNDPIISVYMSAEDLLHLPYEVGQHY